MSDPRWEDLDLEVPPEGLRVEELPPVRDEPRSAEEQCVDAWRARTFSN